MLPFILVACKTVTALCGCELCSCRFDPSCEELVTVCGSIPTFVAAAAASLELLPVMAPKVGSNYSGSNSGSGGSSANGSNTGAGQQAPWHTCSRLPSGWARNVRLETVMTSCRSTEVQVGPT